MITNDILAAMGKVGKLFYDTMIGRLNSGNYPSGDSTRTPPIVSIQDATSVKSPEQNGSTFKEEIVINLKQAPHAAAYEYGSGEHGERGTTYPINPKKSGYMVFPEGDWPQWEDWGGKGAVPNKSGIFFLTHVDHPGVAAKPYIQPTIDQIKDDVKKILAKEFKVAVLREGKPVEIIK